MSLYIGHKRDGTVEKFESEDKPTKEFVLERYKFATGPFTDHSDVDICLKTLRGEELSNMERARKLKFLMKQWEGKFDAAPPGSTLYKIKKECEAMKS